MISKQAYAEFLNRKLDQFDWVKKLTPNQIDQCLSDEINPKFTEKLWKHQKMMLLIMQQQAKFMLLSGMGSGKTLTILTYLRSRKAKGDKPKAIVFVPYLTAVDTWITETVKHAPELVCQPLLGSSKENLQTLRNTDADLYPVCYQSAVACFTTKVFDEEKQKKTWIVDPYLVKDYTQGFDTLVLDEIHRCANSKAQTFTLTSVISHNVKWVYGLTGTPFGQNLESLWAEFFLIDHGETLSPSLNFYRNIFFNKTYPFWGGVKYTFKKRMTSKLQAIIKNKSIHFATDEMVDIPPKQYITKNIHLHNSIQHYVEEAMNDLKNAVKDKNYELIGTSFMRLRQLSSGFLTFKDQTNEDNKERIKIKFNDNPKLDALAELVEEMPLDNKMVVFHEYIYTNELISERLTKMKVGHARIWGGQKNPIEQLRKFREDKNCRVLIINSKSGSSSLNLQFANMIVFYECPSVIDRNQAEARCWRPGQTKKVLIYDLLVNGTLDEEYYTTVREGGDLLKQFLTGKRK